MKEPLISFSIISKYWSFPILLPIFCAMTHHYQRQLVNSVQKSFKMSEYLLPSLLYIFISKILSIVLCIISIIKSKNESETLNGSKGQLVRRYHLQVKSLRKPIAQIFVISFLETIFKAEDYYNIHQKSMIEKRMGFAILVPILYHFLIKKLHRHHFFALIISWIGYTFLVLEFILTENKPGFLINCSHLLFTIPFSFSLIFIKSLFDYYFVSPFTFLFWDGIFCIINSFLVAFIQSLWKGGFDFFKKNLNSLGLVPDKVVFFYLSLQIVFSFFYYLMNSLTIYYFSPFLLVLTDILSPLFLFIISFYNKNIDTPSYLLAIRFFGYFVIIFGASILNEIIILNCWGLNKDTHVNIIKRSILEDEELQGSFLRNDLDDSNIDIFNGNTYISSESPGDISH